MEKKRESWEVEETRFFLRLIKKRQVMKNLDGKRFRSDEIFQHLEAPMMERGYKKTCKQMQTRFRTLKQQYKSIRQKMGTSGSGNNMLFPYAEEMRQLLNCRPVANAVDSTPTPVSDSYSNSPSHYSLYDNEPDARDGAVPGCSSKPDTSNTTRQMHRPHTEDTSSESSNMQSTQNTAKKRKISRSNEAVMFRYAEKLRDNYGDVQREIMAENRIFIEELLFAEKQFQMDMMTTMMDSQKNILQDVTTQLLTGLKEICNPKSK